MLAKLIHQAKVEGLNLTLTSYGNLKVAGEEDTVTRWLPFIQQYKPEIIQKLEAANDEQKRDEVYLAQLVARVCFTYACPDSEIEQAIQTALADYWDALTCYTDLAKQAGMYLNDDRRMCFECAELSGTNCMAARRGELPDSDKRYEPMKFLPRRCQGYKAKLTERK